MDSREPPALLNNGTLCLIGRLSVHGPPHENFSRYFTFVLHLFSIVEAYALLNHLRLNFQAEKLCINAFEQIIRILTGDFLEFVRKAERADIAFVTNVDGNLIVVGDSFEPAQFSILIAALENGPT